MDPNMMGMGSMQAGQLPNTPTKEKLWEDEKSKYRHWIILFGIGIVVLFSLFLVSLILHTTNESGIKTQLFEWGHGKVEFSGINEADAKYEPKLLEWVHSYWKTEVIYSSVKLAATFIAMVLFGWTTYQSYQEKSFAKLSSWASFTVGMVALIGGYELISMIWTSQSRIIFHYSEGIYTFILYILPVGIWMFISRPISKIKRQFMLAERIEAIKKSPQYQAYMQQMQDLQNGNVKSESQMGPFGPVSTPGATPTNANQNAKEEPIEIKPKELNKAEKRSHELAKMTTTELKEICKKLNVSGYSTMKKNEMIEAILRLSEAE